MSDFDSIVDVILAVVAGVFVGFLAAVFLSSPKKESTTCPVCEAEIEQGISKCPYCGVCLRW